MYQWRKMTPSERAALLAYRRERGYPQHSPPHFSGENNFYHMHAACYEHKPFIGLDPERMVSFSDELLDVLQDSEVVCHAWCVLPSHYHLLLQLSSLEMTVKVLGQIHGRSSYHWNGDEGCRGRKVWSSPSDRAIRSERHYWATMNYVHNNAVHHGYVEKWQDWPYTSAHAYLKEVGEKEALRIWREYPNLDYGKGWDAPEI